MGAVVRHGKGPTAVRTTGAWRDVGFLADAEDGAASWCWQCFGVDFFLGFWGFEFLVELEGCLTEPITISIVSLWGVVPVSVIAISDVIAGGEFC